MRGVRAPKLVNDRHRFLGVRMMLQAQPKPSPHARGHELAKQISQDELVSVSKLTAQLIRLRQLVKHKILDSLPIKQGGLKAEATPRRYPASYCHPHHGAAWFDC
jgi:hypothetical protein